MSNTERYITWLDQICHVEHQHTLMQMQWLGCAYRDIGVTTAEEFVAWFDAFKGITSQLPGGDSHETHSDDGGLSLCVRSVQPEHGADRAEEQDDLKDAENAE